MFKIMRHSYILLILVTILIFFAGCAEVKEQPEPTKKSAENVELIISAAASLTDALTEIQTAYERQQDNITLNFNFGSSGALEQQIEQGAPADLFLSASPKYMEALIDQQLVDPAQQKNLLKNELVVVVPADAKVNIQSMEDLTNVNIEHLAIGIPETVPAGNYAKEALAKVNLWDALQSKMVQGKDVRQVLTYVETGNADAGLVYRTDALTSKVVKIAFTIDANTYPAIMYPIGVVKATKHNKETLNFYAFLQSKEAQNIFMKFGFSTPE